MNIVGHCPHCGAPIYEEPVEHDPGTTMPYRPVPEIRYTCECRHQQTVPYYPGDWVSRWHWWAPQWMVTNSTADMPAAVAGRCMCSQSIISIT